MVSSPLPDAMVSLVSLEALSIVCVSPQEHETWNWFAVAVSCIVKESALWFPRW